MNRRLPLLLAFLCGAARVASAQPSAPSPGCPLEPIAPVSTAGLAIDGDGGRVAFISSEDPLGSNPGFLPQVFLWREGAGFEHLPKTNFARTGELSMDAAGARVAFPSSSPNTPGNARRALQVFLWIDPTGTVLITDNDLDETFQSSIDAAGTRVVYDRAVVEAPFTHAVRHELVLWQEGEEERVIAVSESATTPLLDPRISGDGERVAFLARPDPAAQPVELRLWSDATGAVETVVELGPGPVSGLSPPAIDGDGDRFVFSASIDPFGANPDGGPELFLWDEQEGLRQLTDFGLTASFGPSISDDGRSVAFLSDADPLGANPSRLPQVFLWHEPPGGPAALTQVTAWTPGPNPELPGGAVDAAISRDGRRIAHELFQFAVPPAVATARRGLWLSDCSAPEPPFESWLRDPALPGFEVQVRIGGEREGRLEPLCIEETLCVSGALPGRSEVFVRVVGPKPNGRLWPTLVKFSTAEVEVWIRQLSTGEIEYYRLRGARPGFDELPGLFDREGFAPPG